LQVREKLFELCNALGVEPDLSTFQNRKQLQKLTYLFEIFGLDLGFRFSWYVHGPYNRNLTTVLYNDDEAESTRPVADHFENEKEKLELLKRFLGRDVHSSRALELIGSLHYILTATKNEQKSDEEILQILLDLKPQFSEGETRYYLNKIRETVPV